MSDDEAQMFKMRNKIGPCMRRHHHHHNDHHQRLVSMQNISFFTKILRKFLATGHASFVPCN
jgi:hypothetical protein